MFGLAGLVVAGRTVRLATRSRVFTDLDGDFSGSEIGIRQVSGEIGQAPINTTYCV